MITREEAYMLGEKIKVPSIEQRSNRIKEFVDELFDQFESQLSSNTEQLNCDGCDSFAFGKCHSDFGSRFCVRIAKDYFKPKYTK